MKEQCQHIADCEDPLKCGCVTVNEVWKDIPEYNQADVGVNFNQKNQQPNLVN